MSARQQHLIHLGIALLFLVPILMSGWCIRAVAVPILLNYVLMNVLYSSDLMKGGADTACLIAMGMVFQRYPDLGAVPLIKPDLGSTMRCTYSLCSSSWPL
ncbi:hypothetical protein AOA81_02235 [Methanomassiliicoccales archaeon RumEn M2]|nr:hypothetical protein AOA81_02235 [Methanomassiliicoccales archaeon RumEn M2]